MPYCPACGNSVPDAPDTRFCARCGRDLTAPTVPGQSPPPPTTPPAGGAPPPPYAPPPAPPRPPAPAYKPGGPGPAPVPAAPAGPSPAGLFLRRVVAGRWDWPAAVVAAPALSVLALGAVIGGWTGASDAGPYLGWGGRTRMALALLVQGLGGTLRFTGPFGGGLDSDSGYDSGYGYDDSDSGYFDYGSGSSGHVGSFTLSILPLTVTLLWVVALVLGLRAARKRQSGSDTAVRVALLSALAALVLALIAQPTFAGVHVHSGPFLVALWTFVLSLVTALLVLRGSALHTWLAARPGLARGYRALRTALLALLITVAFAGVVVFLVAADHYDSVGGGQGLAAAAALLLLNAGVSGLALAWGAPFRASQSDGRGPTLHLSFGLSELGDAWGGLSVVGVLAGGVLCALVIGVLAVRRSRDRAERFLVAGLFTVLFAVLVGLGGMSTSGSVGLLTTTGGHMSLASSGAESLVFCLLWSFGGVLVGPYARRALGGRRAAPVRLGGVLTPDGRVYGAEGPYGAGGPPPGASGPGGPAGPYGGVPPQAPPPAGPPQPGGSPQPPATQPPVPPRATPPGPTVHDLGVVEPDRLKKEGPRHL